MLGEEKYTQLMERDYKPGFTYPEFVRDFTAEFYNPDDWATLFRRAGAKFIVLTSKHHEGYTLWPSTYHFAWNAMEVGPHRDALGELATAVRAQGLRFGAYYSLLEWYDPQFLKDLASGYATNTFAQEKAIPALKELINRYEPEVLWSDGDWGDWDTMAQDTYWESTKFLAWLYNESPVKDTIVTNDRWGAGTWGVHGGFFNHHDRYNPGELLPHKWENAFTIEKQSWGYRREANLQDYMSPEELVRTIVETVSCGGNVLVNVGPTKDGMIPPILQERLLQMGEWLALNGQAIYETDPWIPAQNDTTTPGVWYTQNKAESELYAMITHGWPGTQVVLGSVSSGLGITRIEMLGTPDRSLQWFPAAPAGITVTLPPLHENSSKWAWTLVIHKAAAA